jgi:hypothetical protein
VPRPLLFWREKKFKIWPEKKQEPKKCFGGPLKQKSKQTKKANKPKKNKQTKKKQTNQKDLKQKSGENHFILFFGGVLAPAA